MDLLSKRGVNQLRGSGGRGRRIGATAATMYNGVGLTSVRGTATNGYVQRNMAFVRPKEKVGPPFRFFLVGRFDSSPRAGRRAAPPGAPSHACPWPRALSRHGFRGARGDVRWRAEAQMSPALRGALLGPCWSAASLSVSSARAQTQPVLQLVPRNRRPCSLSR
jgi:hypothetical protein